MPAANDPDPSIELRPLFTHDCPTDGGIRSSRLRLTDDEYAEASSPRLTVAPNVLSAVHAAGAVRRDVTFVRRQAFTTWLGLRYDRPAVSEHLVPLAQRIAREVARNKHREIGFRVRDVLMQFDDAGDPVRFSLIAVLDDPDDEDDVRAWLGPGIPGGTDRSRRGGCHRGARGRRDRVLHDRVVLCR